MKEKLEKLGVKLSPEKITKECIYFESEGDWNDGDYVNREDSISFKIFAELLPILKKVGKRTDIEKIESLLTEDEYDIYREVIPYGYESDIHTLNYLNFYYYSKKDNIKYNIKI